MAYDYPVISNSHDGPPAPDVWQRIAKVLNDADTLGEKLELYGKVLSGRRIHEVLVKRSSEYFSVEGSGYDFHYNSGALNLTKTDGSGDLAHWDRWMAALATDARFVSGCLFDRDYWWWQNADDPQSYQLAGKPYDHLLMRPTGAPPPLPQLAIDTSRNPGRRFFHSQEDYMEAVGAVMWLGALFFERTGADPDVLKVADWCQVTEFIPGVLRVQVQDACFTSSEGREAELQDRLRALLFPKAVQQ